MAENKLTFDSIWVLVFDICGTITFHGKGELEITTCQSIAACAGLSCEHRPLQRGAYSILIHAKRTESAHPLVKQHVSNLHRGRVGPRARWEAEAVKWAPPPLCHPPSVCSPRPASLQKHE